jgi:four helix bundle protein
MHEYRNLWVWREAVDLTEQVYKATTRFPAEERFGLTQQMRRCAVSICSNIAEGRGRLSPNEWRQFLGTARGSLLELDTQLTIAERLRFISQKDAAVISSKIEKITKAVNRLIQILRK